MVLARFSARWPVNGRGFAPALFIEVLRHALFRPGIEIRRRPLRTVPSLRAARLARRAAIARRSGGLHPAPAWGECWWTDRDRHWLGDDTARQRVRPRFLLGRLIRAIGVRPLFILVLRHDAPSPCLAVWWPQGARGWRYCLPDLSAGAAPGGADIEIDHQVDRMTCLARGLSSPSRSPSARRMADPERTLSFRVIGEAVVGLLSASSTIASTVARPSRGCARTT